MFLFTSRASSMDEIPMKKLKTEPKDEADIEKEKKLDSDLAKQNKLFHKYKKLLSDLTKSDLHELLEVNSQEILKGSDEVM